MNEETKHRRGIPAARANLWVARMAAARYLKARDEDPSDPYEMMLYYGSFFMFARSSLDALRSSDARDNNGLNDLQEKYFLEHISGDPVFDLLKSERDRIGHGDDAWACHPLKSMGMLNRFIDAGHDWSDAVFDEFWPDEPFKGRSIETVMNDIWRKVSDWLDAIDALDEQRHRFGRTD